MISKTRKISILILSLVPLLLLTGCSLGSAKARKPPGDFSRGLPLPVKASSSPVSAVDQDGNLVQVIIPYLNEEQGNTFRYLQINSGASLILDQDLPLDLPDFTRTLKIVSSGDQNHLVWASRESTTEGWGLWHAIVNTSAEIISQPQWISQGTNRVSQFAIAGDGQGGVLILWEDSNGSSIHFTRLSSRGTVQTVPNLLIPFGERPFLAADNQGGYHLVWMQGDSLNYSKLESDFAYPILGDQMARIQVVEGNRLDGPVLGTDNSHVYVFWSILRQRGLEAGTAITESLVFPTGQPAAARRGLVTINPTSEDLFQPYQGKLSLSQIIYPPPEDYLSTSYIYDPRTGSGRDGTQVVAVAAYQNIRLDQHVQIMLGVYEDGEYQGYAVGTRTTEISQNPLISQDKNGNLHLIWQEGSTANRVYYATTAPEARDVLNRVSLEDIPNLILSGGLEAITGILLFPFAFPWMAVGLVIMIILRLARNDEDVTQPLSLFLLVVAILSYQVSKLLFLSDILIYIPFSAWLDLPPGPGSFFRIIVPIVIFGLGIVTAEWRRRRSKSPISSLNYFINVILVDTILTLSVYGVIFLGEY